VARRSLRPERELEVRFNHILPANAHTTNAVFITAYRLPLAQNAVISFRGKGYTSWSPRKCYYGTHEALILLIRKFVPLIKKINHCPRSVRIFPRSFSRTGFVRNKSAPLALASCWTLALARPVSRMMVAGLSLCDLS